MIYSVGHSTLGIKDFLKLITPLDTLIDIRSHPTSKWPQFHQEALRAAVEATGRRYEWEPGLGGWDVRHAQDAGLRASMAGRGVNLAAYGRGKFPKQRIAADRAAIGPAWTNQGLYDYSWFMIQPEFIDAATRLMSRTDDVGIMCAEVLWWKCHRSMVADYVVAKGGEVIHLQPRPTLHSRALGNRLERYDPVIVAALGLMPT